MKGARLILVLVAVCIEAELLAGPIKSAILQAGIALPLVLIVPGAILSGALTHSSQDRAADQILSTLGYSMAVLAVGGVLLNVFTFGMQPITWLAYVALIVLGGEGVRRVRGRQGIHLNVRSVHPVRLERAALCLLVPVLIGTAFAVAIYGAHRQDSRGFAQLWIIPKAGQARYQVGVSSNLERPTDYTVNLAVAGRTKKVWRLRLASGQGWQSTIRVPVNASVRVTLFQAGHREPYRQVFIRSGT